MNDWISLLKTYVAREGHPNVPVNHMESGKSLGKWVSTTKHFYRKGNLDGISVHELEALPGWSWELRRHKARAIDADHPWFYLLTLFGRKYGHCKMPSSRIYMNKRLGQWVHKIRGKYESGQLSPSEAELFSHLPGWDWNLPKNDWRTKYEILVKYQKKAGSVRIHCRHQEGSIAIGSWISTQRIAYKRDELSRERIDLLEALPGWSWYPRTESREKGLRLLKQFVAENNHSSVPYRYRPENFELAGWCSRLRYLHKTGRLDKDLESRLVSMPQWVWNTRVDRWPQQYEAYKAALLDSGQIHDPKLKLWENQQRIKFKRGKLSEPRVKLLAALPGWRFVIRNRAPRNQSSIERVRLNSEKRELLKLAPA